jgi:hypothetical protein
MKSFKNIRSDINEEYYTGPTAYVGSDRTNVGDISGADLGGLKDGSRHKPYPTSQNMKVFGRALQGELQGVHSDAVTPITKARSKLGATGLSFHIDPAAIRGQPLGDAPDRNPSDDFAARELGIVDSVPYEKTLPATKVVFTFTHDGVGVKIRVDTV